MATSVIMKEKTGCWSKMFPNEIKTELQSLVFLKKLFAVAISNCLYLRAIFPEYAFFDKQLEGLNLKILREDSKCPGAAKVISWVRGCFDALDKQYLKSVIIGVFTDSEDPDTVIESFSFKFTYDDANVSVDIDHASSTAPSSMTKEATTPEEIKKATISLMRTMLIAGNTLGVLPNDVMLTMKLLYYDDVTPADYEPPGFKPAEYAGFRHEAESLNVKLGSVKTDHHGFRMCLQTDKEKFTEQCMKRRAEMTPNQVAQLRASSPSGASAVKANTPGNARASQHSGDQEFNVRCPCGVNKDDGVMILCEGCKMWMHAVCFRIMDDNCVPEVHVCEECATTRADLLEEGVADATLSNLTPYERRTLCLLRRSLLACLSMTKMVPNLLAKELDVDVSTAQGLIVRLEEEGVVGIPPGRGGRRQGKIVHKQHLEEIVIPKYFDSIQEDNASNSGTVEENMEALSEKTERLDLTNRSKSSQKRKRQRVEQDPDPEILSQQDSQVSPPQVKKRRKAHIVRTPVVVYKHTT